MNKVLDEKLNNLISELKNEGAGHAEAEELALLSKNLSNSVDFERSFDTKVKFLKQVEKNNYKWYMFKSPFIATLIAIILFAGFSTIVSAQDSLPGQPLYPIKRATESIVGAVNPSFNGQILIRRSNEIKKLSNSGNKNTANLNETIKEYESELNSKVQLNSKAIEVSKANLEDASNMATDGSKLEIEQILKQTETKQSIQNEDQKQLENRVQNKEGSDR